MSEKVPEILFCPISKKLMVDPVSLDCGHSFDRESLKIWVDARNKLCPLCPTLLPTNTELKTNWVFMNLLEHYIRVKNGEAAAEFPDDLSNASASVKSSVKSERIKSAAKKVTSSTVASEPQKLSASITENEDRIHLEIKVPEVIQRHPLCIVCIIDVSGSMGITVGKAEGKKAFTRLDLVKHVLNVLITSLESYDYLALITFSDKTNVEMELCNMDGKNKTKAKECVSYMKQICNTYTAPAIEAAYKIINDFADGFNNSIILFTDGQDTGGEEALQKQFDKIRRANKKNIAFNTFGFSNEIWSALLQQLAMKGDGIFEFIPDQTMIGTVFTNYLASTLLIYEQNVTIKLDDNYEIVCPQLQNNKITLYYGQSKNFLLKRKKSRNDQQESSINNFTLQLLLPNKEIVNLQPTILERNPNTKYQVARQKFIEFLTHPELPDIEIKDYIHGNEFKNIKQFLCEFEQIDEFNPNHEQIRLALQYYNKWGQHYIRSMYSAHYQEQCTNYKSPSLQIYVNNKFLELVEKLTDIFITLPLPEPTGYYSEYFDSNQPDINAAYLMDRDSGCILGTCNIKMENGEYKPINKLKKGDIVYGGARIVCLIKTRYHGSLIKIGKLFITPFHPVFIENKWQFPYDVVMNNNESSNGLIIESGEGTFVFNLVLDKDHIVDVEGVGCITLGHMYDEGILKHDYFGTNKVIEDLSKLNGWNEGFISLKSYKIQRDSNGNVCGTADHIYN